MMLRELVCCARRAGGLALLAGLLAAGGSVRVAAQDGAFPDEGQPQAGARGDASAGGGLPGEPPAGIDEAPSGLEVLEALQEVLAGVIERCEKSVVSIARVRRPDPNQPFEQQLPNDLLRPLVPPASQPVDPTNPDFIPQEYATGVIIDASGLILTNWHVLGDGGDQLWVTTADRRPYEATIKAADERSDLAVLQIRAENLPVIEFGDASQLRKGSLVLALGNPYAIARDGQASATWGMVANVSRKAGPLPGLTPQETKPTMHHFGTLIQTDMKLALGTSGGPLLDLRGRMVGLTVAQAALVGYEQSAGYAIPVDEMFRYAVDRLKEGREVEYGFLGIAPEPRPRGDVLLGRTGTRVASVRAGTPADRFGLRPEDVVTAVNGRRIHDVDGLMLEVGRLPPESDVTLTVARGGRTQTMDVVLAKFPTRGNNIVSNPRPAWRGARVDYWTVLSDSLEAESFALLAGCVAVTSVEEGSPAWNAGLRPGALVSHVDGTPVTTPGEFEEAVADKEHAVRLRLAGLFNRRGEVLVEP